MSQTPATCYELLGVSPDDDAAAIKRAYRRLAHDHHPDRGGDPARMATLNTAYRTLADSNRRRAYDEHLADPKPSEPEESEPPVPADTWGAEVHDEPIVDETPPRATRASPSPNPFPWETGYQAPPVPPNDAAASAATAGRLRRPSRLATVLLAGVGVLTLTTVAATVYEMTQGDSSTVDLTIWLLMICLATFLGFRRTTRRSSTGYTVFLGLLVLATLAVASTNVLTAVFCGAWVACYIGATETYRRQT